MNFSLQGSLKDPSVCSTSKESDKQVQDTLGYLEDELHAIWELSISNQVIEYRPFGRQYVSINPESLAVHFSELNPKCHVIFCFEKGNGASA